MAVSIDPEELQRRLAEHQVWVDSAGADGRQLWLPEADLAGVDLSGRDLTEAHLPGAILDEAHLDGALLYGIHLVGGSLRTANLQGAQLAKANLDRVRATNVRLTGANLIRCTFLDADLRGAVIDRASLVKTMFNGADLRSCSMRGASFDRTSLEGVTLDSCDATGATGTFRAASVTVVAPDGSRTASAEELLALFRRAGADGVSIFDPERPPTGNPGTASSAPPAPPPGWRPDPDGRHDYRWWDGAGWTDHVADGGVSGTDPVSRS